MPIDRGCQYSKAIQFVQRSDGQPIDISTWTFEAALKDGAGTDVLDMSTSGGHFTVFDGPNGWLRFKLSAVETQALAAGPVSFVLKRTDHADGPIRLGIGSDIVRDEE